MNKYFSKLKSLYDNIMKILKRFKNDTEKFTFVLVTSKKKILSNEKFKILIKTSILKSGSFLIQY